MVALAMGCPPESLTAPTRSSPAAPGGDDASVLAVTEGAGSAADVVFGELGVNKKA